MHVFHQHADHYQPELQDHQNAYEVTLSPAPPFQPTQDRNTEQQTRRFECFQQFRDPQCPWWNGQSQLASQVAQLSLIDAAEHNSVDREQSSQRRVEEAESGLQEKNNQEPEAKSASKRAHKQAKEQMRAEMVEKKAKDAADKTKKAHSEREEWEAKKQVEREQRKLQKEMRKTTATTTAESGRRHDTFASQVRRDEMDALGQRDKPMVNRCM